MHSVQHSASSAEDNMFEAWWAKQGEWVEEPNVRRGGESGVQRIHDDNGNLLYAKRQTGHIHRSWLHPFGRLTVLRERDALTGASQAGVNVPKIVYCATSGERGLLVTAALEGYQTIEDWYAGGGREKYGEELHSQLLQTVGVNIARLNRARWQHGCIYAKHVFVYVEGEGASAKAHAALLDLEKCRQRLTRKKAALHDMKQLRRHSNWSAADWKILKDAYEQEFGRTLSELPD
ncbi:lipopolysaccharide kinase InaA family protein [Pseudomonas sp. S9]|uniref:lipopolysaccharide kinase InaA family protein n=1 Tax=Pseudomonas sp. S9 TaxID=686578 RepID=UPI0002557306|nr:lipopolysaccharide kinase InaA family protein [Pseudomonas sp. S9]